MVDKTQVKACVNGGLSQTPKHNWPICTFTVQKALSYRPLKVSNNLLTLVIVHPFFKWHWFFCKAKVQIVEQENNHTIFGLLKWPSIGITHSEWVILIDFSMFMSTSVFVHCPGCWISHNEMVCCGLNKHMCFHEFKKWLTHLLTDHLKKALSFQPHMVQNNLLTLANVHPFFKWQRFSCQTTARALS